MFFLFSIFLIDDCNQGILILITHLVDLMMTDLIACIIVTLIGFIDAVADLMIFTVR